MTERFSASVAGRHMACHASANLEKAIPNWTPPEIDSTPAADRGTSKHEMIEPILKLPNREMDDLVQILEYVRDLRSQRRFKVLVEGKLTATWLQAQPKTTVDLCLYTQDEIHVLDSKFGKIPVEVIDNEQLMFYAVCLAPLAPKAKGVTLHIMQPAAKNFESWFVDTNRLTKFMEDAIATEAAIAAGSLQFGPSDHCKFCPANPHSRSVKGKPLCPVMMDMLYPNRGADEDEILSL